MNNINYYISIRNILNDFNNNDIKETENNIKMESSHDEIISRLKILGKIQKGDKINVKKLQIQNEGILTSFYRTFITQDTRANTLVFIKSVINRSFELVSMFNKSDRESDIKFCQNMIDDLKASQIGIKNLEHTYITDIKFVCDLQTINENISIKLIDFEK